MQFHRASCPTLAMSLKIPGDCLDLVKSLLTSFRCCFASSTDLSSRSDVPSTRKRKVVDGMRCKDISTSDQAQVRLSQTCNFQDLPFDCQLRVFSYLTMQERGRVSLVCTEWNTIASTPSLWSDVDLTQFSFLCSCSCQQCASKTCYKSYKDRIKQYLDHVIRMRPTVRRLCFAFDIADSQDMWLSVLNKFLSLVRVQDLKVAALNWKETPAKSFPRGQVVRSNYGCNDLRYHCRRRQRQFAAFFDRFTTSATKVTRMSLPFDWSSTSICALGRLKYLEVLELDSYFVPQPKFEQSLLDKVLASVPRLKHLTLSVCLGTGLEITSTYRIAARTLEYLNLTGCAGLGIVEVNLPNLTQLWVNQTPDHNILIENVFCDLSGNSMLCLYEILCVGTPKLQYINGHSLQKDWQTNRYDELESILTRSCPCVNHRSISMANLQHRLQLL